MNKEDMYHEAMEATTPEELEYEMYLASMGMI